LKDDAAEAATLNQATEATMQVFQRVGQAMYEKQQATQTADGATDTGAAGDAGSQAQTESEDDVVEGEIVDEGGAS
jgi:hypothetical protein